MIPQWIDIKSYISKATFTFRALKSRNYAIYMAGMLASTLGTWVQIVATGWLVYRLTNSPEMLGLVTFAGQIPSLIITPIAGVYADRMNRRNVIIGTQTISMILSFTLAFLVLSDQIEIWHLLTIAVFNGVANSVDTPFRHAFVRELVDDVSQLQNGIALNSMLFNTARFVGPVIGGILIAAIGEGWCFFINAVSFLGVISSLLFIHVISRPPKTSSQSVLMEMKEGIRYSFKYVPIRYMLILVVSAGLFCLPFQSFLPVFARDILHGDSGLYGLLTGAYGAGALAGAVYLASQRSMRKLTGAILVAAIFFSIGLMVFSFSDSPTLSMAILVLCGWGMIVQYVSVNTLLQTIAEPSMVGRVLSFYGMSFMTVTPLGAVLIGWLSGIYDIRWVILFSSVLSLAAITIYAVSQKRIASNVRERIEELQKKHEL